jgi:tetratricopeptide (TPR) repeat protein
MRSNARRPLLLALIVALAAAPAQADWRKDYDRGLKALEDGRFAEAESAFRAALGEDGQPNARKRFQGVVVKLYVPHYYAGLAAYRQGDCQEALEYWRNSASAAVVAGQPELNAMQTRGIADCTQKLAATTRPPTSTTTTPAVATTTPGSTTTPGTTKPPVGPTTPPVATTKPPVTTPTVKPPPTTTTTTPPSATPAPAALVTLVNAYLGGQYASVTQTDPGTLADGRAKAQGFLLRAAARFTLAELGDEAQREAARRDVHSARAANANLAPDEAMFSPRFRAFWRESR